MIPIFKILLRGVLWPRMWFILANVLCELEENGNGEMERKMRDGERDHVSHFPVLKIQCC